MAVFGFLEVYNPSMSDLRISKTKKVISGTGKICRTMICYNLDKWGGVKCEEHPTWMIILAVTIMFFVASGAISTGVKYLPKLIDVNVERMFSSSEQIAGVGTLVKEDYPENPTLVPSIESAGCDLSKDDWEIWLGDMTRDVRDQSYFFLPQASSAGLFKYGSEIADPSTCDFIFIPRGPSAINYVVSFDGIYQVTIGDNDYWTVTLRASDSIGGALDPIREFKTKKTRPRLIHPIKPGSAVKVSLEQNFTEGGRYEVRVKVNYKPSYETGSDPEIQEFSWIFSPPPSLSSFPPDLSVGLIRAADDTNDIGVNFVYPKLIESTAKGQKYP